jgi:hypothetical protein
MWSLRPTKEGKRRGPLCGIARCAMLRSLRKVNLHECGLESAITGRVKPPPHGFERGAMFRQMKASSA